MSLVRWGQDGSNVYVYNEMGTDKIRCCCEEGFRCDTDAQMAEHLKAHKKKGHKVPGWVFRILAGKASTAFYINKPTPEAPAP